MTRFASFILSALLVAASLVGGSAQAVPQPQVDVWMTVCNSDFSITGIYARNSETNWSAAIAPGDCYRADNAAGALRIDPDNETVYPHQPDCNRWRIGHIGVGYEGWVNNDPDVIINPPNSWSDSGIRVHTD